LVVAPASLLENWERELALWCPRLRVVTYHGAHKEMVRNQLEKWRYDVSDGAGAGRARLQLCAVLLRLHLELLEQLVLYSGARAVHTVLSAKAWRLP
jgi:SNF2 family DNA or RNA helicase